MLEVEFEKTKIKNNFSSNSSIKEIKQSLKKQLLANKNKDYILIKIYINGKEIKDENIVIGSIVEGEKGNLLMACLTLTDEIVNDEKKIYENLIKNLSKTCVVHCTNKALNVCMNCTSSICDLCIQDHPNHKIISKKEIITYEENLINISGFIGDKFNEMGIKQIDKENPADYQEFYKQLRLEISKQCEILLKFVEEIKKKEIQLMNNFKLDLDPVLPSLLDYRDKVNDLILQITENKKEKILRYDSEFIDFYLKYLQVNNVSEKSKQSLLNIKSTVGKYKEIIVDFKYRTDLINKTIHENVDKIRSYDISIGNPTVSPNANADLIKNEKALNSSFNLNNFNTNNKNDNLNYFNSVNKNDNVYNISNFNSNNLPDRGRASTPENYNNVFTYSNNFEPNLKQQNDNLNPNNSFQQNNLPNSSKLNLINLLGSTGKNKNNLIKSINRASASRSSNNLNQSMKNLSNNTKENIKDINNINILTNLNKSGKSLNMAIEDESPINLLNEQKEDTFIIQNKIFATQISTKNIFIFDNSTNSITKQEIDFSESSITKFESNQSTINYNNKFYISGGSGFYSARLFFELDQETFKLKKLNDMLFKHPYHSLLGAKNSIFAISGFNSKKCEKFDLKAYSWAELPDLNDARSFPNCVFLEDKFIYVFGGLIDYLSKSNLSVERLNVLVNASWEKLEISCVAAESIQSLPFYCGLIRTSSDKLLLLGGKYYKESLAVNSILNYNLKENNLQKYSEAKLPNADEFQGKLFLKFESNKFAQFSAMNSSKLYIYDENDNSFEIKEIK